MKLTDSMNVRNNFHGIKQIVIIGASGHGKVCAEIAEKIGYREIIFLDDDSKCTDCNGYKVIGDVNKFRKYISKADFFVAVGNSDIRRRIIKEINTAGGKIATLIHPEAIISSDVKIGEGSVIMAGAVINPCTEIGKAVIINTLSSVDHDCRLEDYVHVSVGAHLAGSVHVGNGTWIGVGAVVSNNIEICAGCMIGAGAVVVSDINVIGTYIGVPAKRIKKI